MNRDFYLGFPGTCEYIPIITILIVRGASTARRDRFIAVFAICAHECVSSTLHARPVGQSHMRPARLTAALVFLIQLLAGKGKGEKNSDK